MDIFKAYAYSSPFVIVGSVSLFLFFTKFSFKNSIIGKNNDIENNNKLLKGDKDE
jgi:hypothetical protein